MSKKIICKCGKPAEFVDSSAVYGRSYGMIYLCRPCGAYVGVHKGTNEPLGTLADAENREWRKKAHFYFDQIARTTLINIIDVKDFSGSDRAKAYRWLSDMLKIEPEKTHIGMFDVDTCKKVVDLSIRAIRNAKDNLGNIFYRANDRKGLINLQTNKKNAGRFRLESAGLSDKKIIVADIDFNGLLMIQFRSRPVSVDDSIIKDPELIAISDIVLKSSNAMNGHGENCRSKFKGLVLTIKKLNHDK